MLTDLHDKVWRRARPHVVPHILIARTDRLEREREWRMRDRKQVILGTAITALRTPVVGSPHLFHPPPRAIEAFPPITQLTDEDSLVPLSCVDPRLAAAIVDAAQFVDAWCAETQALLASLLPDADAEQPDLGLLDRATSVFRMQKPGEKTTQTAIGWDDARGLLYWCSGYPASYLRREKLVQFSMRGALTAAELAGLLGQTPGITTAAEMDAANARFVCGRCPRVTRRQAMQWRDCVRFTSFRQYCGFPTHFCAARDVQVMHDVENAGSSTSPHSAPSWALVSRLATADVQRREEPYDYCSLNIWSCMLCNDYLARVNTQNHEYISDHIRSKFVPHYRILISLTPPAQAHDRASCGRTTPHMFRGVGAPAAAARHARRGRRAPHPLPMQRLCAGQPRGCQAFLNAWDPPAHHVYVCIIHQPRFIDIFIHWGFVFQGISSNRLEMTSGPRWN